MRAAALLVFVALLLQAGCVGDEANAPKSQPAPRTQVVRASAIDPLDYEAPLTNSLEFRAPENFTGPWAGAFWLQAESTRVCNYNLQYRVQQNNGVVDVVFMAAKGWIRPEVQGRIIHQFHRGDGYLAHVEAAGQSETVKRPNPGAGGMAGYMYAGRITLPTVGFVVVASSYLPLEDPFNGRYHALQLTLDCDGYFRVRHAAEGPTLKVFGPDEFSGGVQVDSFLGPAIQQEVQKTLHAEAGLVALLHEDAGQGIAQYSTRKPDGTTQIDTLGNRIVTGPPGEWRFGLSRIVGPGGEFRLFAFDTPVPELEEPSAASP